ncbi:protein PAM71, chloroplastic [Gastrolobium bilobum]|uniref:protein PAM71, chloroplastic n=1 Tax=Gastrolobium bilobum TaxID=150636 RepID=UPI002AB0D644|nr:protein PAM71, chloroplastic [Gastrolobium bilobum]
MHSHSYSLLRPHSLLSFPKPFASSSFVLLPSTLLSKSKRYLPPQSSTFSSCICCPIFRNETKCRILLSTPSCNQPPRFGIDKLRGTGEFTRAYKNCCTAAHSCNNSGESVGDNSNLECHLAQPIVSSAGDGLSIEILKFMLLFGFLTLEDSYPAAAAAAASDFTSGLNPLPIFGDIGDISTGFASAFLLIFFSELGDKTFFIAALLAARNSAGVVFIGTFGALAAMTLISVVLGRTFHYVDEILPFRFGETDLPVDDIAAVCLLVYFGVSTLLDASSSDGQKSDDEQKEAELAVSEFSGNGAGILAAASTVVSTFFLVFVAEWGDKSFFSTIALAAASSPLGVIAGALAGHGVATLLAVLGGSLLGTLLSEKVIAYIGGVLFLVFAAVTLFEIVQ